MEKADKVKNALQWYDKNKDLYERCAKTKMDIITQILESKNIPYHSITYRVKDRESYRNKCENDKYTDPVKEIMDLSGIRIIAYTNNDVHKICEIIEEEFIIDEENSMDKHDIMSENQVGYLSVHFIAKLKESRTNLIEYKDYEEIRSEIQVRTLLQHAWAEIEHDRNYKFSGVLPKNIRRKFYLLSGVLELVDNEFDSLSKEIDLYAEQIEKKVVKGNFEIGITSNSLEQYLIKRCENYKQIEALSDGKIVNNEIIEELTRFGFNTIKDIDDAIKEEYLENANTYIGILRTSMVCNDAQKYFEKAYNYAWKGLLKQTRQFWEKQGVKDLEKYMKKYGIFMCTEEDYE